MISRRLQLRWSIVVKKEGKLRKRCCSELPKVPWPISAAGPLRPRSDSVWPREWCRSSRERRAETGRRRLRCREDPKELEALDDTIQDILYSYLDIGGESENVARVGEEAEHDFRHRQSNGPRGVALQLDDVVGAESRMIPHSALLSFGFFFLFYLSMTFLWICASQCSGSFCSLPMFGCTSCRVTPATLTPDQTATDESPCSPMIQPWHEEGAMFNFSPSKKRNLQERFYFCNHWA